jgi:ribosomal protein S18 acetylase RimI-like enzyme
VKLKAAYLELFNAPETHKYVSLTLKLFDEQTVTMWFKTHRESGTNYYAALDPQEEIIGLGVTKADPVVGFELLGLVVRPDCRGQGVGRKLADYMVGVAQQAGFRAVNVAVFADNKPMLRLMIDLDFMPVRMMPRARADGADLVYLKRYLAGVDE